MNSALHLGHLAIPRIALATGAVVAATFVAAIAAWSALPGNAADSPPAVTRHAPAMDGMKMPGMKMPGMKMPASSR